MIKFINSYKNKKSGFSLVEVIVALAIFAIFSLVVAVIFQLVFKLHMNTDEINTQMSKQATTLDKGNMVAYDADKDYDITFNGVSDTITANGQKVASGATDDRLPIKVFD